MTYEEKIDKLIVDVAVIKAKVEGMPKSFSCAAHQGVFEDHETRLRNVEEFSNRSKVALFLLQVLGSFIGVLVGLLISFFKDWK